MRHTHRIAFVILAILAILFAGSSTAIASQAESKVIVCKYVGTPGDDERLQTGNNPISVSVNALEKDGFAGTFPFAFEDAQGRSVAVRYAVGNEQGDFVNDCGGTPTSTPTPTPTPEASSTPSEAPPSESPSEQPSATPTPSPSETPLTSSSPTLKPSSKPTPEQRVITPPSTDTEPASTAADETVSFLTILALIFVGLTTVLTVRPRHR